jgi:F0F1-type ATP synthase assembly protein I
MPSDDKPDSESTPPPPRKGQDTSAQLANAMELPFTFVAAVAVGGLIGYFLDQWLHTSPWLMIVFGGFGFAGGILEIMRRFRPKDSSSNDDKSSH